METLPQSWYQLSAPEGSSNTDHIMNYCTGLFGVTFGEVSLGLEDLQNFIGSNFRHGGKKSIKLACRMGWYYFFLYVAKGMIFIMFKDLILFFFALFWLYGHLFYIFGEIHWLYPFSCIYDWSILNQSEMSIFIIVLGIFIKSDRDYMFCI